MKTWVLTACLLLAGCGLRATIDNGLFSGMSTDRTLPLFDAIIFAPLQG